MDNTEKNFYTDGEPGYEEKTTSSVKKENSTKKRNSPKKETNEEMEELKKELAAAKKENKALLEKLKSKSPNQFDDMKRKKYVRVQDVPFIQSHIQKAKNL